MNETLKLSSSNEILEKDLIAIEYLSKLDGKRTARHAAEEGLSALHKEEVAEATKLIRNDITGVFKGEVGSDDRSLDQIKESYWSRASQVGAEHGARPEYKSLDDYFGADPLRNYEDLKAGIEKDYAEDSVTRSVLDGIDAYHQVLGLNPANATTIVTELIAHKMPDLKSNIQQFVAENFSNDEATKLAFDQLITVEVPYHINQIISRYGYGDESIRAYINKPSFYPGAEKEDSLDTAITLSVEDIKGLIRAYDIQSRPYSRDELELGGELAATSTMQAAMLHIHEQLIAFSEQYLKQNPDRAKGDLRNFSEIFVKGANDGRAQLLPNPKLLRAMVNNIMPGIARSLIGRGAAIGEVTSDDIIVGTHTASKEYKLFQANIGQFKNFNKGANTAELHSIYRVVCPANALFPSFLTANLASFYKEAESRQY